MAGVAGTVGVPARLKFDTAPAALAGVVPSADANGNIDLAGLAEFDSSALAVLLAWSRSAQARGGALNYVGVPAGLRQLAQLYGTDGLLFAP